MTDIPNRIGDVLSEATESVAKLAGPATTQAIDSVERLSSTMVDNLPSPGEVAEAVKGATVIGASLGTGAAVRGARFARLHPALVVVAVVAGIVALGVVLRRRAAEYDRSADDEPAATSLEEELDAMVRV
jgi:hypothetical protein